jgi:hypothetical protein
MRPFGCWPCGPLCAAAVLAVFPALVAQALAQAPPATPARTAPTPAPTPRPKGAGIGIGTLAWLDREIDRAELPKKTSWQRLREGDSVRTGDSFKTGADATARLEFPWMAVTLGGSTLFTIPASTVLSTVLEQGRAEFSGEGRDLVKIYVGEAEVRGGGRLVLRRSVGRTSAAALDGSFRLRAQNHTVEIKGGQGTLVEDGRPPEPARPLPSAPGGLVPGKDPAYVRTGRPVELRWAAVPALFHVELLALDRDQVLLARDVSGPPVRLEVPWLGTYRWRVVTRDGSGIESRPSSAGLICSVER